jgi:hypothetical protein
MALIDEQAGLMDEQAKLVAQQVHVALQLCGFHQK